MERVCGLLTESALVMENCIECYDFIKAVAEGGQAVPDFRHGLAITRICDAVAESSSSGKWVSVAGV